MSRRKVKAAVLGPTLAVGVALLVLLLLTRPIWFIGTFGLIVVVATGYWIAYDLLGDDE